MFDIRGLLMPDKRNIISSARSLLTVGFLLAVATLALAAVSLRPAARALSEHYRKQPIAIRRSLWEFDVSVLPSFKDTLIGTEIKTAAIETDEYAFIRFDATEVAEGLKSVVLFVTYYSDPESKVPHTPDVCYRQAGAIVKEMRDITIDIPSLAKSPKVEARLLLLQRQKRSQVVIFTFYADGQFKNSREQVRWGIGMPGNRHVYFSKIETVASYEKDGDPGPATELCKKLFAEAAPVLVSQYFPTKEQVKR